MWHCTWREMTGYVHNYCYVDNVISISLYTTTAASGEDEEQQEGDELDWEDDGDDMYEDDDVVCDVHKDNEMCLLIQQDVRRSSPDVGV